MFKMKFCFCKSTDVIANNFQYRLVKGHWIKL